MNPPPVGDVVKTPSIATSGNITASGFPEISYYYSEYFVKYVSNDTKYNQTFDVAWAMQFLNISSNPKNYLKQPYILLHIGNLQFLFNNGYSYDNSSDDQYLN